MVLAVSIRGAGKGGAGEGCSLAVREGSIRDATRYPRCLWVPSPHSAQPHCIEHCVDEAATSTAVQPS